jgi:hypothetical protein
MDEGASNLPIITGPDSSGFKKEEGFSHDVLVMDSYRKCVNALSKEMVEGKMKSFFNARTGKEEIIMQEDTRRTAIECITTLKNVMINDLQGKKFHTNIKSILKNIDDLFKAYKSKQREWWNKLSYAQKESYLKTNGNFEIAVTTDNLDNDTFFYWEYMDKKIGLYRDIFEQLELCLADARYLRKKRFSDTDNIEPEVY